MLLKVAQRHEDWVRMVVDMGEKEYPEDIVQEAYIKLHRYVARGTVKEETINTYFYLILKSIYLDLCRVRSRVGKVCLDNLCELITTDHSAELEALEKIYAKIDEEVNEWYWYDRDLFSLYVDTGLSQRGIADKTKISLSSVHNTLRRCGDKIRAVIEEDYEDFKYKDYERI